MTKKMYSIMRLLAAFIVFALLVLMLPVSATSVEENDAVVSEWLFEETGNSVDDSDDEETRAGEAYLYVLYGTWQTVPTYYFSGTITLTNSSGVDFQLPVSERASGSFSTFYLQSVRFEGYVQNYHTSFGNNFNFDDYDYQAVDITVYFFAKNESQEEQVF